MLTDNLPYINIKKIHLAHEFVLDKNNKCHYPNGRNYYGIVYCIDGEAKFVFSADNSCTVKAGNIIILSKNASYSIITKKKFKHYTVNFDIHSKYSNLKFINDNFYLFTTENQQWYSNAFKKLISCWSARKICFEMYSIAYLYELFSFLFSETLEKQFSTSSYLRLNPAKEYIEQNYTRNISLNVLANLVNMSVSSFRREWLKLYGESPLEYRDKIRLSYAERYLVSGYYSISEIAEKCGFSDANYFIRFFKKHKGLPPGKYEKLL